MTQDAASILTAGAGSVAVVPRFVHPRNMFGGRCAASSARGGLSHGSGLAGQQMSLTCALTFETVAAGPETNPLLAFVKRHFPSNVLAQF